MKNRKEYLLRIIKEKEKALKKAPEGSLRISTDRYEKDHEKTRVQFYHYKGDGKHNGTYIPLEHRIIAERLAQKDYDSKILRAAKQELNAIEGYFGCFPKNAVENVYDCLSKTRQELIIPIRETDEEFAQRWQSEPFLRKTL